MIPGRDRREAVIMADHYDTAYMDDHYDKEPAAPARGWRRCGADDNHSATAALMLAAPIFLEMSKRRQAGLRRLAGPPDRRGVPRRLPRGAGA